MQNTIIDFLDLLNVLKLLNMFWKRQHILKLNAMLSTEKFYDSKESDKFWCLHSTFVVFGYFTLYILQRLCQLNLSVGQKSYQFM